MIGFGQSEANYTVTFDSNWSQATHPHPSGNLPSNAHWSKLVGATHNDQVVFLEMGQLATPGVEDIAELGSNTVFFSEVTVAINAGNANQIIDGPDLNTSLGQIVINDLITTEAYPLLTLASMIAPSPDWFVAINSVSLLDTNGDWIDEIILDLYPYDAGTDSGADYTSANNDTNPADPISNAQGVAPFSSEIMGTLTISLESVLGTNDVNQELLVLYPNPSRGKITVANSRILQSIEIYNVIGEKILSEESINTTQKVIDITSLASGVYLVRSVDELNNSAIKRLIKW